VSPHVLPGGLGDWIDTNFPGPQLTPIPSVSAFYWLLDLQYMLEIAEVLQLDDDAQQFAAQLSKGCAAYHERFYNATVNGYGLGSQVGRSCPLLCHYIVVVHTYTHTRTLFTVRPTACCADEQHHGAVPALRRADRPASDGD
jgi:hypothetical protein